VFANVAENYQPVLHMSVCGSITGNRAGLVMKGNSMVKDALQTFKGI
jgi:hypothetical protein